MSPQFVVIVAMYVLPSKGFLSGRVSSAPVPYLFGGMGQPAAFVVAVEGVVFAVAPAAVVPGLNACAATTKPTMRTASTATTATTRLLRSRSADLRAAAACCFSHRRRAAARSCALVTGGKSRHLGRSVGSPGAGRELPRRA